MSQAKAKQNRHGSVTSFVLLEVAAFFGILSGSMVFMLMPWAAVNLSHSSMTAGIIIAITNIPGLVFSPLLGSVIDKFGRRRSAILFQVLPILTSLAFPVVSGLGAMTIISLAILGVLRGLVGNGAMSARKSLLPDTVSGTKITLERANGLHESIAAGGFATGPAIASLLIGLMGTYNVFYVVGAMELAAVLITVCIHVYEHHEKRTEDEEARHWLHYATQGFRTVAKIPSILILIATFTVLSTVYLPTEIVVLPNYYTSVNDPKTMGFLLFDMAFFTMLGSFLFERMSKHISFANLLRGAILLVALPMIPMSFLPPNWAMYVFGAVLGFAWGPMPPLVNIIIQRKVPASQRGRVFSLEATIWAGGPMVSMGLVGWGVDALGVRVMYPLIAFAVLLAAVVISTRRAVNDLNIADYEEN